MAMYVHTGARVYQTATGELVAEGDPRAAFLLIAPGGTMPMDQAEALGLVGEKAKPAPANKNKTKPANKGAAAETEEDA